MQVHGTTVCRMAEPKDAPSAELQVTALQISERGTPCSDAAACALVA